MLNVQPLPPAFAGQLDFDLSEPIRGTACLKSGGTPADGPTLVYWMGNPAFETTPALARGIVAAAVLDAIEHLGTADTILVTRVLTEAKDDEETCAYVYGRGLRLRKAGTTAPSKSDPLFPSSGTDQNDDADSDESD